MAQAEEVLLSRLDPCFPTIHEGRPRPAAPALEFTIGREHAIRSDMSARELIERKLEALRDSLQREGYDFDGVDDH